MRIILTILIVFTCALMNAQNNEEFCEQWCGEWNGMMEIYKNDKLVNSVEVSLTIAETDHPDTMLYLLQYGEQDVRDYRLVWVDRENGVFNVDEKNSIVIPTYYHAGCLLSHFEVEGSSTGSQLCKEGDSLMLTFITFNSKEPYATGGKEDVPTVNSYPIIGYQKALLSRN